MQVCVSNWFISVLSPMFEGLQRCLNSSVNTVIIIRGSRQTTHAPQDYAVNVGTKKGG